MARREAVVTLDINAEVAALALEYGHLAERGAQLIAERIRESIPLSEIPSLPGQPPHSRGNYRGSWRHGRAKRRGMRVTAYTYSMMSTAQGVPLALVLEDGLGRIEPRPHWRAAVERARREMDGEVSRATRGGA